MKNSYSKLEKEILNLLGSRIRYFRNLAGISQEKLAFLSELDRTYIGSIERGERNISFLNIIKISKALNIHVSKLLDVYVE